MDQEREKENAEEKAAHPPALVKGYMRLMARLTTWSSPKRYGRSSTSRGAVLHHESSARERDGEAEDGVLR